MKPQSGYAMSSGERVLYDILNSLVYGHPVSLYNLIVLDAETRRVAWEAIGIASGIEGARPSNEAAAAYACGYADCKEGLQNRNPFLTTARKDHDS